MGCRTRRRAHDLVRVRAHGPEGAPVVALGPGQGRGAWLCRHTLEDCAATAHRRGALTRALRREDADGLWRRLEPLVQRFCAAPVQVGAENLKR